MVEFAKKYPGVAGKYLGTNAMHKGFLLGLPGYEAYDIMANREGIHPNKGMASNLGATAASGLGWLSSMPLGWVGAPLAVDALSRLGGFAGSKIDKAMGNKALKPRQAPPALSQQQLAHVPHHVAKQVPATMSQLGPAAMSAPIR